jgi:hypothetical protein
MTNGHRVLVVDEIFLIGLDIQRILADSLGCEVVCMDVTEAETTGISEPYSAIVFDNILYKSAGEQVKALLDGHRDRLIWTTTDTVIAGSRHFDPLAVAVSKPFDEENIIRLVGEMIFASQGPLSGSGASAA